jgi:hypothetical protein
VNGPGRAGPGATSARPLDIAIVVADFLQRATDLGLPFANPELIEAIETQLTPTQLETAPNRDGTLVIGYINRFSDLVAVETYGPDETPMSVEEFARRLYMSTCAEKQSTFG